MRLLQPRSFVRVREADNQSSASFFGLQTSPFPPKSNSQNKNSSLDSGNFSAQPEDFLESVVKHSAVAVTLDRYLMCPTHVILFIMHFCVNVLIENIVAHRQKNNPDFNKETAETESVVWIYIPRFRYWQLPYLEFLHPSGYRFAFRSMDISPCFQDTVDSFPDEAFPNKTELLAPLLVVEPIIGDYMLHGKRVSGIKIPGAFWTRLPHGWGRLAAGDQQNQSHNNLFLTNLLKFLAKFFIKRWRPLHMANGRAVCVPLPLVSARRSDTFRAIFQDAPVRE